MCTCECARVVYVWVGGGGGSEVCVERRRKILVSICGPDCTSRLVSLVWHSLVAQELPEVER